MIFCFQKKAFRPRARGDEDRFKIELLFIPELRPASNEIVAAIALEPEVELKRGAQPRNPNVRKAAKSPVKLGENQEA